MAYLIRPVVSINSDYQETSIGHYYFNANTTFTYLNLMLFISHDVLDIV